MEKAQRGRGGSHGVKFKVPTIGKHSTFKVGLGSARGLIKEPKKIGERGQELKRAAVRQNEALRECRKKDGKTLRGGGKNSAREARKGERASAANKRKKLR